MADDVPELFATATTAAIPRSPLNLPTYCRRLADLAAQDIHIGTSSWKNPGWCGLIYDEQRYFTCGKFSEARFNETCFKPPRLHHSKFTIQNCQARPSSSASRSPTTSPSRNSPISPRCGARAGTNPNFLNPEMFTWLFLGPCATFRSRIAPLIFEFSTFHKQDFEHGRDFLAALDTFLGVLPKGWDYGVEIRNKTWLVPEYFAMLRSHGVARVFNNWTRMPSIAEQLAIGGSSDAADFTVSRFLLKPGRTYEASVETFSPYTGLKEPNEEARRSERFAESSDCDIRRLFVQCELCQRQRRHSTRHNLRTRPGGYFPEHPIQGFRNRTA